MNRIVPCITRPSKFYLWEQMLNPTKPNSVSNLTDFFVSTLKSFMVGLLEDKFYEVCDRLGVRLRHH